MTDLNPLSKIVLGLLLWVAGMLGVVTALPLVATLRETFPEGAPPSMWGQNHPVAVMGGRLAVAVCAGVLLAPRVGLSAPALEAVVRRRSIAEALFPQVGPGVVGGLGGWMALLLVSVLLQPLAPTQLVEMNEGFNIPLLPRLLYGGITEEIVMRWGLMTFIVWLAHRLWRGPDGEVRTGSYATGVVVSAVLFGVGHLPSAIGLVGAATAPLIIYIVSGNAVFGIVFGYLYWRHGFESAVVAHVTGGLLIAAL